MWPDADIHPAFDEALAEAKEAGVKILFCSVIWTECLCSDGRINQKAAQMETLGMSAARSSFDESTPVCQYFKIGTDYKGKIM